MIEVRQMSLFVGLPRVCGEAYMRTSPCTSMPVYPRVCGEAILPLTCL